MTKSQIFTTAWVIAKQGAAKFGGSSKDYFAASLKIAYKLKGGIKMTYKLEISEGSRKHPSWVAKVTGKDAKWGFKREFINTDTPGDLELEDGVYNIKNGSRQDQQFLVIKNGEAKEINKEEVLSYV